MRVSFDPLWKRLLQGGVGRGPARRYLAELKDHLDDLIAEERRAMGDARNAETRALHRLGSFEMLADAMIERREFQAWSRKAPFAAYLVAPAVALAAGTAIAVVGVVATVKGVGGAATAPPAWLQGLADGAVVFSHVVLPVLLAWALSAMAIRHRASWFWPVCGIVALSLMGAAFHVDLALPSATAHGEVSISSASSTTAGLIAFAGLLGAALLPYVTYLLWRTARPPQRA